MKTWTSTALFLVGCLGALLSGCIATPLDDYVAIDDGFFSWLDTGARIPNMYGCTGYILNVTSQKWLTLAESSRPIWYHMVAVIVPDDISVFDTAGIWITGGSNDDTWSVPSATDEDIIMATALAASVKMVAIAVYQVPNQPIVFPSDPTKQSRSEDAIIAFTWAHFLDNPLDPYWLLRLPMTKAAIKCMDATTAFVANFPLPSQIKLTKWVVAGASKRGWTTWTVGAVDKRVIAIVPVVMDLLNFSKNVHHMMRAYGGWTFAFKDYYALNLTARFDDPNMPLLEAIVDPYAYIDRLTMPKLLVNAADDEFFMPDDTHMYWPQLQGETHFLLCQNAEHSMFSAVLEALDGVTNFLTAVIYNRARPTMYWDRDFNSSTITLRTSERPTKVVARVASTLSTTRRDFRWVIGGNDPCAFPNIPVPSQGICVQPILWAEVPLNASDSSGRLYQYTSDVPATGWRGVFLEAYFQTNNGLLSDYRFTTEAWILPNTFPFPDCSGPACRGNLV